MIHKGSCHCGAVEIHADLENGFDDLRRCDCSLCRRKGAVMASVPLDKLTVAKGAEALRLYQWNTKTAEHYFCGQCGIYTHHRRRSNPNEYGVNVACFEGVDLEALESVGMGIGRGSRDSVLKEDQERR